MPCALLVPLFFLLVAPASSFSVPDFFVRGSPICLSFFFYASFRWSFLFESGPPSPGFSLSFSGVSAPESFCRFLRFFFSEVGFLPFSFKSPFRTLCADFFLSTVMETSFFDFSGAGIGFFPSILALVLPYWVLCDGLKSLSLQLFPAPMSLFSFRPQQGPYSSPSLFFFKY